MERRNTIIFIFQMAWSYEENLLELPETTRVNKLSNLKYTNQDIKSIVYLYAVNEESEVEILK